MMLIKVVINNIEMEYQEKLILIFWKKSFHIYMHKATEQWASVVFVTYS